MNGSISIAEPTRPFQTGLPVQGSAIIPKESWVEYLLQAVIDFMIPIPCESSIICDHGGILTTTEPNKLFGKVVPVMTNIYNLSHIINMGRNLFTQLDYVKKIKTAEIEPGHAAVLSVFVWMPSYDYEKMMELVRIQRRIEQIAEKHGCEIDSVFLPLPHVDPKAKVTVRPSTYLE